MSGNESFDDEAYWSHSRYEARLANAIFSCFNLGSHAYDGDYAKQLYMRSVDMLVSICPIHVKKTCFEFKKQLNQIAATAIKNIPSKNHLHSYVSAFQQDVEKTDTYLAFVTDECEKAGLTVKSKRKVRMGGDGLISPTLHEDIET